MPITRSNSPHSLGVPWIETELFANPAAGANFSTLYPRYALSECLFFSGQLNTDANAGDRFIHLNLSLDAQDFILATSPTATIANSVLYFRFAVGLQAYKAFNDTIQYLPIPPNIRSVNGDSVQLTVIGKKAGDQLSTLRALWNRWPAV